MKSLNIIEKKTLAIATLAVFALLFIRVFHDPLYSLYDPKNHLAIHTILEFFSITISFSIFIYGWLTFRHFKSQQLLFIALTFFAVGSLDLFHTLTYSGMPHFITESSIQKATSFWLAARLTEASFILGILLFAKRSMRVDRRPLLFTVTLCYVSFITVIIFTFEHSLPIWVIEGQGTTPLKNGIEYFISFLHLLAIVVAVTYYRKNRNPAELSIALAFFFLLICELIFTVYNSVYDFDNFLGHIYKVIGYYYLLKGFYFTAIDEPFTDNKVMKVTLKTAQQEIKAMFDYTANAIVMVDLNGKIIRINPAFEKIFGYSSGEVVGKPLPVIPIDKYEEANQLFKKVNAGEAVIDYETKRQKKDGTLIDVSLTFSPIKDENENIIFYSAIVRDISDRKKTEELLIKSEKLSVVGELSAGFAHEIRNPLTTIKGFMQLIEPNSSDEHKSYIQLMQSELDRIEMITNEFMTVAKPQAIEFNRENIVEIIHDVTSFMNPQALLHNAQFSVKVIGQIPLITCAQSQLKQVFINLLKNAIEAMPKGGNVYITLAQLDEKHISIRFEDQGCGIPADLLPKLGEPFYSLKEKGTGLGLMVSYKVIEAHHGKIDVLSKVNQGTTFTITLPIHHPSETNPPIKQLTS